MKQEILPLKTTGFTEKPPLGTACNGWGMCCMVEPCKLAQEFMGSVAGPCEALELNGVSYVCGLVARLAWYLFQEDVPESQTAGLSVLFASALGLGMGCDADDVELDVWKPIIFMGYASA